MWDAIVNYVIMNEEPVPGAAGLQTVDDFDLEFTDEELEIACLELELGLEPCTAG